MFILHLIYCSQKEIEDLVKGDHPEDLLSGILSLKETKCSYRLEPYWTYEVCHGLHVRQFHEEKGNGPGKVKLQEFYLGRVIENDNNAEGEIKAKEAKDYKIQTRDIDGRATPFYNFTMDNGTPCDINNNKPRRVDILYICHPTSNNEVMSVKEVSTCEYEVIILTPHLCENPAFMVQESPVHDIKCLPLDGSPSHPSRLSDLEATSLEEKVSAETRYVTVLPKGKEDAEAAEMPSGDEAVDEQSQDEVNKVHVETKVPAATTKDDQLTKEFFNGDYCLQGGSGWWLYEFCYGKYIQQFHQDTSGKTVIHLGYWNKEKHLDWVKTKKNFMSSKHVTHYYSNGELCDITGRPRNAQVKLKCMNDKSGQQIAIYMLEPKPCEYIVGIESPIFCPFIESADQHGLFDEKKFTGEEN